MDLIDFLPAGKKLCEDLRSAKEIGSKKGNDRCVGLSSCNTAEVSRAEAAELRGFLVAKVAAAAQLKDGQG